MLQVFGTCRHVSVQFVRAPQVRAQFDFRHLHIVQNKAMQSTAKWRHSKLLQDYVKLLPSLSLPRLPVTVTDGQTDGRTDRAKALMTHFGATHTFAAHVYTCA